MAPAGNNKPSDFNRDLSWRNSSMYESATVFANATSQLNGLHRHHRKRVTRSGLLPSDCNRPNGTFSDERLVFGIASYMRSLMS